MNQMNIRLLRVDYIKSIDSIAVTKLTNKKDY